MIYRDINVLTTPLLYYIGVIFLKIFGAKYLVYRIYNLVIITTLNLLVYIIFKKLNISKKYSLLYTILIAKVTEVILYYGANYNALAILFTLIGIILKLEKFKNNKPIKYYNIYEGILMFLIIFTKQNIGAYYVLSGFFVELLMNKKEGVKNFVKQIVTAMVPGLLWCIYLIINNSLYNFVDYTILGMREFSTKNMLLSKEYISTYIFFAFILVYIIWFLRKNKIKKVEIKILLPYSIIYLLIAYPILEKFHLMNAGLPLIILFTYIIHISFVKELKLNIKSIKYIVIIYIVIIMLNSTMLFISYLYRIQFTDEKSVHYGSLYAINEREGIERITDYIKKSEERVIILCPQAAIYNVPLGIDNGILDIPTQGNVGKNGAEKILNKLKEILENEQKIKILLSKEKNFWQEFDEVREWVQNNAQQVGEIEGTNFMYNIYYFKK